MPSSRRSRRRWPGSRRRWGFRSPCSSTRPCGRAAPCRPPAGWPRTSTCWSGEATRRRSTRRSSPAAGAPAGCRPGSTTCRPSSTRGSASSRSTTGCRGSRRRVAGGPRRRGGRGRLRRPGRSRRPRAVLLAASGPTDASVAGGASPATLRVPSRPVLLAHALVHGLVQHGWAPRSYPPWRGVSDWIDLGLGEADGDTLLAAASAWIGGSLAAEEARAARRLCALLVAGRPEALTDWADGEPIGRRTEGGPSDRTGRGRRPSAGTCWPDRWTRPTGGRSVSTAWRPTPGAGRIRRRRRKGPGPPRAGCPGGDRGTGAGAAAGRAGGALRPLAEPVGAALAAARPPRGSRAPGRHRRRRPPARALARPGPALSRLRRGLRAGSRGPPRTARWPTGRRRRSRSGCP